MIINNEMNNCNELKFELLFGSTFLGGNSKADDIAG
jgi:hypothetical protein